MFPLINYGGWGRRFLFNTYINIYNIINILHTHKYILHTHQNNIYNNQKTNKKFVLRIYFKERSNE
nr:MAG TPA: hypothetical protein [Crassvirales sp.]